MKAACRSFALCGILFFSTFGQSEPWLATRFAQNCAACHAPGRVNVAPVKRRCTLSCQGCHTNPNGGGLRSAYGKWTQERWLNSFYFADYKLNKPRPLPTNQQSYSDDKTEALKQNPEAATKVSIQGFRLKETTDRLDEKQYDRTTLHERLIEPDVSLALAHIPDGDPWRTTRLNSFNAGIDSRYFYLDYSRAVGDTTTKMTGSFPMGNDLAVSVEPIQGFTAVFESRFLNGPNNPAWDNGLESSAQVRSAYLLVNDLPWNSFIMYGIYRPLFGNYSPDHTSLFSYSTGLDHRSAFKALSIGTAPNVPFANVHFIEPMNSKAFAQDRGYALNLGGRFVTLGAYGMFSYWNTSADGLGATIRKQMSSITGGLTYQRYTLVADLTKVQREIVSQRSDSGVVTTMENRFRFWRENYLKLVYEGLNTARDLSTGATTSYTLGVNAFLVSSTEIELVYRSTKETLNSMPGTEQALWAQFHVYF